MNSCMLRVASHTLQDFLSLLCTIDYSLHTGMQAVAKHCKSLTALDIYDNAQLGAEAIPLLNCTALKVLNLVTMPITDETLKNIADSCPNLQVLNLVNARGYTSAGLEVIAMQCVQLKKVVFDLYEGSIMSSLSACLWRALRPGIVIELRDATTVHPVDIEPAFKFDGFHYFM